MTLSFPEIIETYLAEWDLTKHQDLYNTQRIVLDRDRKEALSRASFVHILDEKPELIKKLFYISHYSSMGFFRQAMNSGDPVVFTVEDSRYIKTGKPTVLAGYPSWIRAISVAIILRDSEAINELCATSHEFLKSSQEYYNPLFEQVGNFIKGLFSADGDVVELAKDLMVKSDPKYLGSSNHIEYSNEILMPFCNVLLMASTRVDEEKYRSVLLKEIESHARYFSANSERESDAIGWFSLPLMAAAALVYDRHGYTPIDPDGYLVDWLVRREFEALKPFVGQDKLLSEKIITTGKVDADIQLDISEYLDENVLNIIEAEKCLLDEMGVDLNQYSLSEDKDKNIISVKIKLRNFENFPDWYLELRKHWQGYAFRANNRNVLLTKGKYHLVFEGEMNEASNGADIRFVSSLKRKLGLK